MVVRKSFLLAVWFAIVVGLVTETRSAVAASAKRVSISFVFPNNQPERGFYPYFVARDLKFFDEENLEIKFVNTGGSGVAIQQMIAGQVEAGTPHASAVLNAASRGNPMRHVYTFSTTGNFGLFVKESSPVKSVKDLKGKTVGITEPGSGEVAIVNAALKGVGIDPTKEVRLVPIGEGGPVTFQAIESDQVDAYSCSYNDLLALTDMAAGKLKLREITPPEFQVFPSHGISTLQKSLDEADKKEAIIRLGRSVAKATLFCQTNRPACISIMKKVAPPVFKNERLGEATITRVLDISKLPEGMKLGSHRPDAWEKFVKFTTESDAKFKAPDLRLFLVNDHIDQFNNFDREKIIKLAREHKTP